MFDRSYKTRYCTHCIVNICWKRKIIKKIRFFNFPLFFANFRIFAPKRCFLQRLMINSFLMSYNTLNRTWSINYASFRKKNYKGNGIFQFSAILLQFYACFAPKWSFSLLFWLKCLMGHTRHGTVPTKLINIRWKSKIIQKIRFSHFPRFFANFRTFYPKTWLFCNPKWITFLYVLQSIE